MAVGALSGLVAAVAMTLVQALLRLALDVPSPAELIGDRLGERVPVKPFLNLIGRIGSYYPAGVEEVGDTGVAQIDKQRPTGPEGATGLHHVLANVA